MIRLLTVAGWGALILVPFALLDDRPAIALALAAAAAAWRALAMVIALGDHVCRIEEEDQ